MFTMSTILVKQVGIRKSTHYMFISTAQVGGKAIDFAGIWS